MPEFNIMAPPKSVTDPLHVKQPLSSVFPRHVHRAAPKKDGDAYTSGEYKEVTTDDDLEQALADGWSLTPVRTAPVAPAAKRAKS